MLVALLLGTARAQPGDPYEEHLQNAGALYNQQRYEDSLVELRAAYALYPLPRLLYNFGQVHRKLGHDKEALESYDLFLRTEPNIAEDQRAEVERHIGELRKSEPPRSPPKEPPPPMFHPALDLLAPLPAAPPRKTPPWRRWWFWTAAGAVVAGTVAGVVAGTYHPAPGIPNNIPFHTEK